MADFIIIGGGVYGCGAAWELARRGASVRLLEANTIASGASGGMGKRGVRANGRDLRELPLMRLAYERWPSLHEEIGGATGYDRIGHLELIERESDYRAASARAWVQEQQGIPTRFLEGKKLRALEPHLNDKVIAALFCPLDGVADHTATTQNLAAAAQKAGAVIQENTRVEILEHRNGVVQAVVTSSGERIPLGKKLLVLTNAGTASLIESAFGVQLPVWWRLPQVVFTAPVEMIPMRHLIGHAHRTLSMKYGPDHNVMISGGWRGRWNSETGQGETIPEHVAGNLAEAVAVYPILEGIAIQSAAADRQETETPDKIPIIGELPGISNLLVGTGWAGHGWAIAPAITQLLAEWALTEKQPALLKPFEYTRFLG